MKRWIVVANSSYAEFYDLKGKDLKKIKSLDFPEGRFKGSQILSDRPGRGFESSGGGLRHALSSETDVHRHEQEIFAHKIIEEIKRGKAENKFEELIIIAPPEFLGEIKHVMHDIVKKNSVHTIAKDIPDYLSDVEKKEMIEKMLELEKGSGLSPWQKEYQKGAH